VKPVPHALPSWLLLAVALPLGAQPLRWDCQVGFEGVCKAGHWTPVSFVATNDGSSTTASFTVTSQLPQAYAYRYGGEPTPPFPLRVSGDLPQASKHRYTLYAPSDGLRYAFADAKAGFHEQRELTVVDRLAKSTYVVVVIGGDPGLLSFLNGAKPPGTQPKLTQDDGSYRGLPPGYRPPGMRRESSRAPEEIRLCHADWATLPESRLGWDSVDAVILGDAGVTRASEAALQALLTWVRMGGTLVAPGGRLAGPLADCSLGAALPARVRGTETVPGLDALGAWVREPLPAGACLLAQFEPRQGAWALGGPATHPLALTWRLGAGRVVAAAFDYTALPVKRWHGQTAMWRRLLDSTPADPEGWAARTCATSADQRDESLDALATRVREGRLPSTWLMFGFLLTYIITLVPVQYAVLKRLDRRELGWITTPLIVAGFTLTAYLTGFAMRGGQVVLNRIGVVHVAPGGGLSAADGYVGLFSPGRRTFDLTLKPGATVAWPVQTPSEDRLGSCDVVFEPEPKLANVSMNMWTSRVFGVTYAFDAGRGIEGFAEWDGKVWSARVRNLTGHNLRRCTLVWPGLGPGQGQDLAPGAEKQFGIPAAPPLARAPGAGKAGKRSGMVKKAGPPSGPGGPPGTAGPRHQEMDLQTAALAQFTTGASEGMSAGGSPGYAYSPPWATTPRPDQATLVGLCEGATVPVELARARARTDDTTVVVASLPLRLARGARLSVPGWAVHRRLLDYEGDVSHNSALDSGLSLPPSGGAPGGSASSSLLSDNLVVEEGAATLEFSVPVSAAGVRAGGVTFTHKSVLPAGTTTGSGATFSRDWLRIYDFAHSQWVAPPVVATDLTTVSISGTTKALITYQTRLGEDVQGDFMSRDGRVLVQLASPGGQRTFGSLTLAVDVRTL
jgi:hypothetical protein